MFWIKNMTKKSYLGIPTLGFERPVELQFKSNCNYCINIIDKEYNIDNSELEVLLTRWMNKKINKILTKLYWQFEYAYADKMKQLRSAGTASYLLNSA